MGVDEWLFYVNTGNDELTNRQPIDDLTNIETGCELLKKKKRKKKKKKNKEIKK